MTTLDISTAHLAISYLLLIIPLGVILWLRIPLFGEALLAVIRMTLQLLFVGFYLQFVFTLNSLWVTAAWVLIMVLVADVSIAQGCHLHLKRLAGGLFVALLVGTLVPLLFFVFFILQREAALQAQYLVPICGMILGNCLRADIIGLQSFYTGLRKKEKLYQLELSQGASQSEALFPFMREACRAALAPTIATISTIGLVALPGMMTGVILGGGNPMTAIKYQIAIMLAIFSGTALAVVLAIRLTIGRNFNAFGMLDRGLFKS
ncbi:ABC transporter permease [Geopsychrobacter electrodiphilus]|uniref:ABC transporter permease n=1 Tax=Geopsychrobacter electrodiphilus TaxID=225196 RepID=UPI00037A5673|nr:ABC transporter permease [Geopsychrobacter electrodiphilus]